MKKITLQFLPLPCKVSYSVSFTLDEWFNSINKKLNELYNWQYTLPNSLEKDIIQYITSRTESRIKNDIH